MDVKPGRYRHFKGGLYQVLFTARHTETDDPVVVYLSLTTGEFFVRPEIMWGEAVLWPDGICTQDLALRRKLLLGIRFALTWLDPEHVHPLDN